MSARVGIEQGARPLRARLAEPPEILVVGGSGLDALAEGLEGAVEVPFADVPGLPATGVGGHAGRYAFGTIAGRRVLVQAGRFHFYEGHPREVVELPVRLGAALGARVAILTNASGGIRPDLVPGSIVTIGSHLDLQGNRGPSRLRRGTSPEGPGDDLVPSVRGGAPLPIEVWDREWLRLAAAAAGRVGLPALEGCYAAVLGPAYETPAEVRMLAVLGADLVGMSTVPEALAARDEGMAVLGLSVVTDGAGGDGAVVTHEEVLQVAARAGPRLVGLLREIVGRLPASL